MKVEARFATVENTAVFICWKCFKYSVKDPCLIVFAIRPVDGLVLPIFLYSLKNIYFGLFEIWLYLFPRSVQVRRDMSICCLQGSTSNYKPTKMLINKIFLAFV